MPRNYTGPRTPRKEKAFAQIRDLDTPRAVALNVVDAPIDLLANYKTDIGVNRLQGVTAMRIFGSIYAGNDSAATNSTQVALHWGFTWLRNVVLTAGSGDAQIPDPSESGAREAQWLQTGVLRYGAVSGVRRMAAEANAAPGSYVNLDITQQRKQPGTDYGLALIFRASSAAGSDPAVWIDLTTMLALS